MKFDRQVFTSKVARRAFLVFVGCALVPVSILAFLSERQVTAELRGQSERRLRQASKAVGLILHQRILALEPLLESAATLLLKPSDESRHRPFLGVAHLTPDGRSMTIAGQIGKPPDLSPEQTRFLASGQTLLATVAAVEGAARFFLLRARDQKHPAEGTLVGEINPAYLWVVQDEEALERGTKLVVLDESGRTLISSFRHGDSLARPGMFAQNAAAGQLTWNDGAEDYMASYWSLFLRNQFLTERWIIVLSRPLDDVLAPIADFHRVFAFVCVLSLLFVLYLSVGQIRKILEPIAQLRAFTARLAAGHLDARIEVRSRDEFADLGQSFNQMAGQLGRQFDALTMRSEITVALSRSERSDEVLRLCMEILVRHLRLATVGVWLAGSDEGWLEQHALSGGTPRADDALQRIRIGQGAIGRVAAEGRPFTTNALTDDACPGEPVSPGGTGVVAFVCHPLVIDGRIQGVAAAYTAHPLDVIDLASLSAAFGEIAQGIARRRAAESLRDSEEQVRQLQKMEAVGRLTGGIAHDFNNLLTVVMCASHVLTDGLAGDDPRQKMATIIRDTAMRSSRLTQQLLMFSRKHPLAPTLLDLNAVIGETTTLLQRMIGENISLSVVPGKNPGLIKLDRGQIEQVIVNLVVNARDAMPTGGQITIETATAARSAGDDTRQVLLKVTDTGTGMDTATQARIFEPFFTTKAAGKGTGLGLATVQGIVAQSGGTIRVESKLGHGSSFIITFPLAAGIAQQDSTAPTPPPRGQETVLLVEDEYEVRLLLQKILEDFGYTVLNAARPSDALTAAESHAGPIHLLVTDMVLPQMDGAALSKRLAATRPAMAVLRISGYTDYPGENSGLAFLQKPFAPGIFARKVREVLDSSHARAAMKPDETLRPPSVSANTASIS